MRDQLGGFARDYSHKAGVGLQGFDAGPGSGGGVDVDGHRSAP
ncbi:hypothetical protein ACMG4M_05190 [Alcanivorax sp. IL3]